MFGHKIIVNLFCKFSQTISYCPSKLQNGIFQIVVGKTVEGKDSGVGGMDISNVFFFTKNFRIQSILDIWQYPNPWFSKQIL